MTSKTDFLNIEEIITESNNIINEINEYDKKMEEKNTNRLLLIEKLRELLPGDIFLKIEDVLTKAAEGYHPLPDLSCDKEIILDFNDPAKSLKEIRCTTARDVCSIMEVDIPIL